MLTTPNLNLYKPEGTDSVSPSPFNDNADILDDALIRGAQTLTSAEQTQVQSNLDVPSTSAVSTEIAGKAVRYDVAQTLSSAQQAQARNNIGHTSAQILNITSITATPASVNCAWDSYEYLSFAAGIGGVPGTGMFVPVSFFTNTSSSIYVALPVFDASGTFAFQVRAYQNGSGKIYVRLAASTSYTPRLRVWGII